MATTEQIRQEAVNLLAQGDSGALQRLIVGYHNALRAQAVRGMDEALRRRLDPEDILQDAYVAAFQSFTTCHFAAPAQLYKWLEQIVQHKLRDAARAAGRQKRDAHREFAGPPNTNTSYHDFINRLPGTESTPSRKVSRSEDIGAVLAGLAQLSPDQRAVLRMRFLEGYTVSEIAAHLARSEGAVHTLTHRGLKSFRSVCPIA